MKRDAILQKSLDSLAAGDAPDALDRAEIAALGVAEQAELDVARRLAGARAELAPRPGFVRASRRRLLAQLPAAGARRPALGRHWAAPVGWRSPALQGALLGLWVFMLFFSANRLASASPAWLPGDLLYPLKPLAEDAALLASFSPEQDAALHIEYANRRLVEIQSLALEGRFELIPGVVAQFDRHVTAALVSVSQLSGSDRAVARQLAQRLDASLSNQVGVVSVLSGAAPGGSRYDFQRLLAIAADSVSTMHYLIAQ